MLSNLLDNADHYAGGATHIEVRADEDTLILSVIDNGQGLLKKIGHQSLKDLLVEQREVAEGPVQGLAWDCRS